MINIKYNKVDKYSHLVESFRCHYPICIIRACLDLFHHFWNFAGCVESMGWRKNW